MLAFPYCAVAFGTVVCGIGCMRCGAWCPCVHPSCLTIRGRVHAVARRGSGLHGVIIVAVGLPGGGGGLEIVPAQLSPLRHHLLARYAARRHDTSVLECFCIRLGGGDSRQCHGRDTAAQHTAPPPLPPSSCLTLAGFDVCAPGVVDIAAQSAAPGACAPSEGGEHELFQAARASEGATR